MVDYLKKIFIGEAKNPLDQSTMHNISLVAFFAWIGLGADGLSSSCYGPPEAYITLGNHHFLGLLVGIATAITIFIIAESYSQIIELFPTGGGGYLVASKLLSPNIGMVSGCALLIDYILTITLSIASGADALFSFLPMDWLVYKVWFAAAALLILIILNLRGIKESVTVLMPIFLGFVITHVIIILYALVSHLAGFSTIIQSTAMDIRSSTSELGFLGMIFLMMRAYSMGAGTYTGIEAVSNGLPILREPKVKTAKKTMFYMVISLASIVIGLFLAYALFRVEPQAGKTINAVLFNKVTGNWGIGGYLFTLFTLISEAAILFVASQTGFTGGPMVLANMAADHWVPKRFALLSDRLVTINGILIMGIGSLVLMVSTNASVGYLVVLYSINVFITFCFSQVGMVKYWWRARHAIRNWIPKISLNGIGLIMTSFILVSVTVIKFYEGGWITLFITGALVLLMSIIKMNYNHTDKLISKLNRLVEEVDSVHPVYQIPVRKAKDKTFDPNDKTAVILVKDYSGTGLKALFSVFKQFGGNFNNFVFLQVGLIDAAAFKGHAELEDVQNKVKEQLNCYVELLKQHGYNAEGIYRFGTDTVEEIDKAASDILKKYPNATFFGGQIIFPKSSFMSRLLHNYTVFSAQQRLYKKGIPLFVLPIELPVK